MQDGVVELHRKPEQPKAQQHAEYREVEAPTERAIEIILDFWVDLLVLLDLLCRHHTQHLLLPYDIPSQPVSVAQLLQLLSKTIITRTYLLLR